ncbi:hypothetical protein [uncultured Tateyamaria sp.]|uniref:hypothetical protein n=1 Tax=uncultured Tateyamaria sp. TaxID=455651 RepID=UPI002634BC6A|nr:hypothetical protein [uncultured Tateyamaria sp.]
MAILSAEYGIDPTGLGGKLGLTALAQDINEAAPFEGVLEFNVGAHHPNADLINQSVRNLIHQEDAPFYSEVIETEHKFIVPADTTFVYSWEVLNAFDDRVYYDFHGHPSTEDAADYPNDFGLAYAPGEATGQHGSFTAPFSGYHGSYIINIEEGPIRRIFRHDFCRCIGPKLAQRDVIFATQRMS